MNLPASKAYGKCEIKKPLLHNRGIRSRGDKLFCISIYTSITVEFRLAPSMWSTNLSMVRAHAKTGHEVDQQKVVTQTLSTMVISS